MDAHNKAHPLGAAGWTLSAFVGSRALTLLATLVLARLVEPADFGVVAVAGLLILTLSTATSLGLGSSVVLVEADPNRLRTTFTLLLTAGLVGTAVAFLLAAPLATLFGLPRLAPVLEVLSVSLFIGAVSTIYDAILQREQLFRARFLSQLVQSGTFAVVAIVSAINGAGVWSLVAGQLSALLAQSLALVLLAPYRVSPGLERAQIRRSLEPAGGFLAHGILEHLQHNLDVGTAGYRLGSSAAGYYSMAFRLADIPYAAITAPVATVAFPALARKVREGEAPGPLGLDLLAVVTLFACPGGVLISATAAPLVEALLGSDWIAIVGSLTVLGAWSVVAQVEAALGWFLNSVGRASTTAAISAAITVGLIPVLYFVAGASGIVGIAWAMLGSSVVTAAAMMVIVDRSGDIPFKDQFQVLVGVAAGGIVAWICARLVVEALAGWPAGIALIAATTVGVLVYYLVIRILQPDEFSRGTRFLRSAMVAVRSRNGPASVGRSWTR